MDAAQLIPAWHSLVVGFALVIFGFVAHVIRGFINLYPDKISDNDLVNIVVSDDYSTLDHILGVEFTDYGYYDLNSGKNLTISISLCLVFGYIAYFMDPMGVSTAIDQGVVWLGNRIVENWNNMSFGF